MRKIIPTVVLSMAVIASASAQSAAVRIKAAEAEIPTNVIESFKRDFNGSEGEEWAILPAKLVGEEYVVTGYNDLNGEKPSYYSVKIKGSNVHREALYDTNGKLLRMKEVIKDTALPAEVRKAIIRENPGYAIVKDNEIIKEGKSNVTFYRVIIRKGNLKKLITTDPHGTHLKEKKIV
jgi:hypothetical protein